MQNERLSHVQEGMNLIKLLQVPSQQQRRYCGVQATMASMGVYPP